jgi:hypothetical protein
MILAGGAFAWSACTGAASQQRALGDGSDEADGCTLTQGYWKNHEESWPVSSLTIGGVDYGQAELLELLRTPTRGDGSLILGHQLIAALLNVAAGASSSAVSGSLADAEAWMATNKDADGRLPYGVHDGEATALGDALAALDEGAVGPGHCDGGPPGDDPPGDDPPGDDPPGDDPHDPVCDLDETSPLPICEPGQNCDYDDATPLPPCPPDLPPPEPPLDPIP